MKTISSQTSSVRMSAIEKSCTGKDCATAHDSQTKNFTLKKKDSRDVKKKSKRVFMIEKKSQQDTRLGVDKKRKENTFSFSLNCGDKIEQKNVNRRLKILIGVGLRSESSFINFSSLFFLRFVTV